MYGRMSASFSLVNEAQYPEFLNDGETVVVLQAPF